MNGEPYSTVREAMRLMQTGNLLAATAAIRHRLSGATSAGPLISARSPDRGAIEGTFGGSPFPGSITEERTQFSEHKYTGSAGTRRYKLFIPSAYRGQPLPLIVMLHGCTQTPDDFATGTRMNMLAEERACFVVYPAQTQSANVSKCWNWFQASNQRRDQGEPAIIAGLVRELLLTYDLDRERVYVGGLSAGGAMAVILGRAYPELFAAIGVHSGLP
ncbi:MAG: PHB depolymerase family esterase, partial [Betaproteobacteria bacterium]